MLTQNNVPTEMGSFGCDRHCLGKCCLPVSKLPLYLYKKDGDHVSLEPETVEQDTSEDVSEMSFLHNLLLGQWENKMKQGIFRNDLTKTQKKFIPGHHGFIAQLNEERILKKRPTEFCLDQVLQPFNDKKFNFTKIGQEEVLFMFEQSSDHRSHFVPNAPVEKISKSPNIVAINVSPIEYGHVLLIPRVLDCLPQRIDHESFLLAMYMAKEAADSSFRLGYNSLGAFATINHLHFQAYYLAAKFPVEKVPTQRIYVDDEDLESRGVYVSQLLKYPVRGLVFEGGNSMVDLSYVVASKLIFLQNQNIPFNVLISDSGKRIFLFPQCFVERQVLGELSEEILNAQVSPAVWEICGHILLKRREDFDAANEEYACKLLDEVSLSEERFQKFKFLMFKNLKLQENGIDNGDHELNGV